MSIPGSGIRLSPYTMPNWYWSNNEVALVGNRRVQDDFEVSLRLHNDVYWSPYRFHEGPIRQTTSVVRLIAEKMTKHELIMWIFHPPESRMISVSHTNCYFVERLLRLSAKVSQRNGAHAGKQIKGRLVFF